MKLCYSTLGCVNDSLETDLRRCADYGISALEIRGMGGVLRSGRIDALCKEKEPITKCAFEAARVKPLVLGTSCAFHQPDQSAAIEEGLEAIDIARRFSIPYLRLFGNSIHPSEPARCIERVIGGISLLLDAAEGSGVSLLLEVHGDFNTIHALAPVTEALGKREHFGLIWDIAHTHAPYGDRWEEFYEFARPFIRHVHIKDRDGKTGALTLTGEGDLPILPICRRLLADRYEGYFSLEWERQWVKTLPPIDEALARFTALMRQV